jgi:hypothetical protein
MTARLPIHFDGNDVPVPTVCQGVQWPMDLGNSVLKYERSTGKDYDRVAWAAHVKALDL